MFAKYQGVFRSRWKALFWAAGILMTAYCTVPSPDETDGGDASGGMAALMGGQSSGDGKPHQHVNPWALKK
jgi:hypothetical protein